VSRSTGSGATTGRIAAAVVLGIVAIAFLVVGVIYSVEPAGSQPTWLGHETAWINNKNVPSPSYHPLRAVGSLIAGVVFAIGSWFTLRYQPTMSASPEQTTARVPERQ
jgi:glucose uptake protein GlcU